MLSLVIGNEAFYYLHQDGMLQGAILTLVGDFTVAETEEFEEKIHISVSNRMNVSKVERDKFRYTSLDVEALDNSI